MADWWNWKGKMGSPPPGHPSAFVVLCHLRHISFIPVAYLLCHLIPIHQNTDKKYNSSTEEMKINTHTGIQQTWNINHMTDQPTPTEMLYISDQYIRPPTKSNAMTNEIQSYNLFFSSLLIPSPSLRFSFSLSSVHRVYVIVPIHLVLGEASEQTTIPMQNKLVQPNPKHIRVVVSVT